MGDCNFKIEQCDWDEMGPEGRPGQFTVALLHYFRNIIAWKISIYSNLKGKGNFIRDSL